MNRPRLVAGLALAVVVVAAFAVSPATVISHATWVAADPVRLVVAASLLALVRPLLAWPTTLLALVVGYGLGPVGIPFALALIVLTSIPPFLFARHYREATRLAEVGEQTVAITGSVRGVTASRLLPVPSDVVSVAAGVANVRLGAFALGTAIGELPWAIAGVVAGASVETLTTESLQAIVRPEFAVLVALAGVALLVPPVYRRYRSKTEATTDAN
ncbi:MULTISPECIES: TVP38/TMEM64 family protein [Haloferax]|uniref:TVP38/TMEM64 family protein n=1 Tax=Haloferax marinum TaxID=2666143 RepID=A0A6A8G8R8_9EURY|nr:MULTISPECIES: VTT domain-containing protein [Haloferax]KAB1198541.1 TVP38/TMEM64 family protein [Haloferax sp. CBA1150]MRW97650.1 TVP38/TMEM64 family protein [Haloferax marinum]